jgi:hypothetical protein
MNAERPSPFGTEPYRSLQILDELSKNDSLTQRDLSSSLGIALGLVTSYSSEKINDTRNALSRRWTKKVFKFYLREVEFASPCYAIK